MGDGIDMGGKIERRGADRCDKCGGSAVVDGFVHEVNCPHRVAMRNKENNMDGKLFISGLDYTDYITDIETDSSSRDGYTSVMLRLAVGSLSAINKLLPSLNRPVSYSQIDEDRNRND